MTTRQSPQTPGLGPDEVRPPSAGSRAPRPGVAAPSKDPERPTARMRRTIRPTLGAADGRGFTPTDDYVRRYWIPVLGPGAVADLLRLTAAAHSGRSLKEPVHLPSLLSAGLVSRGDGAIVVPRRVAPLPAPLARRLPPALRRSHRTVTMRGEWASAGV